MRFQRGSNSNFGFSSRFDKGNCNQRSDNKLGYFGQAEWKLFYTDPFLHRDSRTCKIEEIEEENNSDDTATKDPTTNKDTLGRLEIILLL